MLTGVRVNGIMLMIDISKDVIFDSSFIMVSIYRLQTYILCLL